MTPEPFHTFFVFVGILICAGGIGATFALGVALVCRWLKWAPVNTTINIYNPPGSRSTVDDIDA